MLNNGFNHQIILGFVYIKEKERWKLACLIGERDAENLGIHYILRESPVETEPPPEEGFVPPIPFQHLTRLVKALEAFTPSLAGAFIHVDEEVPNARIRLEVRVKPLRGKPQHREDAWKESTAV